MYLRETFIATSCYTEQSQGANPLRWHGCQFACNHRSCQITITRRYINEIRMKNEARDQVRFDHWLVIFVAISSNMCIEAKPTYPWSDQSHELFPSLSDPAKPEHLWPWSLFCKEVEIADELFSQCNVWILYPKRTYISVIL